jgi:hypothetical protein
LGSNIGWENLAKTELRPVLEVIEGDMLRGRINPPELGDRLLTAPRAVPEGTVGDIIPQDECKMAPPDRGRVIVDKTNYS